MEVVKFAVAVVLVLSSFTPSNAATTPPSGGGAGGGDPHSMPCIQKLMPCQPYLHTVTPPPPPSCCLPLREIVTSDVTCLCSVFNNVDMLKSLNLTKENALVLPNACGAKADVSQCKASAGTTPPSMTPATPKTPPASSTGGGSTGDSATTTAKSTSSAPAINFARLLSFASAIVATLFF
ncbi:Non-specific lipid transfer protein GPI-anchored 3 [Cardamine amara subsp. amara]|uniref:Non-specific lipid transfer protein GPI-anchored 3 n=1 Tax=Cardamine amara subsp. amara TaxID=228776 RepID=A0ABD1B5T0_CARAN